MEQIEIPMEQKKFLEKQLPWGTMNFPWERPKFFARNGNFFGE
jgi:hypothetical protein